MNKLFILLTIIFISLRCHAQVTLCDSIDAKLYSEYERIFPFYYGDFDSLAYYSDMFSDKFNQYLKNEQTSFSCSFKQLSKETSVRIVKTSDNLLRIYSWNTWLGGTMHNYRNVFQFVSDGKVYTKSFDYGDGDMGTLYTKVYSVKVKDKICFLAVSLGTIASSDYYRNIRVYSINNNDLIDSVRLIKTQSGLCNSIGLEFRGGEDNDIKYDDVKKIICIPVVLKNGLMTKRYIKYKFTGQYFEKI